MMEDLKLINKIYIFFFHLQWHLLKIRTLKIKNSYLNQDADKGNTKFLIPGFSSLIMKVLHRKIIFI
jgi:hypothetical protein